MLYGKKATANVGIQYGIHMMSPEVTIEIVSKEIHNCASFQNMYIACHHRETIQKVDTCAQYLFSSIFDTYFISVLNACKWSFFQSMFGFIYIKHMNSDDRYWSLVETMLHANKKALCVYPDRSGSLYYGYQDFYFRDGLFAASLFTGLPIVDILVFEPKANKPETTIELRLWSPDHVNQGQVQNAKDYSVWRHANKHSIDAYTSKCEAEYKSRIQELETVHKSCDIDALEPNKVCLIKKKNLEFDWNMNRHEFVAKKNASKSIP
jgi:hypothetical protein